MPSAVTFAANERPGSGAATGVPDPGDECGAEHAATSNVSRTTASGRVMA